MIQSIAEKPIDKRSGAVSSPKESSKTAYLESSNTSRSNHGLPIKIASGSSSKLVPMGKTGEYLSFL